MLASDPTSQGTNSWPKSLLVGDDSRRSETRSLLFAPLQIASGFDDELGENQEKKKKSEEK
jgi:hypothetical protein